LPEIAVLSERRMGVIGIDNEPKYITAFLGGHGGVTLAL